MNQYYNQNYTREQINDILKDIKDCIRSNRYSISMNINRQENINFIEEYRIDSRKQKDILLNLEVEDFCHTLQNTKIGYEYEVLYVFVPQVELFNAEDELEVVDIYLKFNIISIASGKRTVVISFHKKNRAIDYLFR